MSENNQYKDDTFTDSGTNIEEVKRNNEHSGMTYNEVKQVLAETMGSQDEGRYSQTNIAEVKKGNH